MQLSNLKAIELFAGIGGFRLGMEAASIATIWARDRLGDTHKSCILLLSWEKPTEIATLEGQNRHCRSLQLGGLGEAATEILSNKGLKDEDKWGKPIQLYRGNPSWLNIIAATIADLFNRSVDRYLSYPGLFLGDLEPIVEEYYQRLSESEKIVIQWLANQKAADIFAKPSDTDFLKAVQSLIKRGLIEKASDNESSLLDIPALVKNYVKNYVKHG